MGSGTLQLSLEKWWWVLFHHGFLSSAICYAVYKVNPLDGMLCFKIDNFNTVYITTFE